MECMKENFSVSAFMEYLKTEKKEGTNTTEVLHEILSGNSTGDVTATPEQLLELMKNIPMTVQQYTEEINYCKNISDMLGKIPSPVQKRRLL